MSSYTPYPLLPVLVQCLIMMYLASLQSFCRKAAQCTLHSLSRDQSGEFARAVEPDNTQTSISSTLGISVVSSIATHNQSWPDLSLRVCMRDGALLRSKISRANVTRLVTGAGLLSRPSCWSLPADARALHRVDDFLVAVLFNQLPLLGHPMGYSS